MRPCAYALLLLIVLALSVNLVHSGYWFQSGATGDSRTYQNNGASIQIQTVAPQNDIKAGSAAFWIGENLNNGAFIQIGYLIENLSGYYPSVCTSSGCGKYQNLTAGDGEWFFEYFPSTSTSTFLGEIGPGGSAGVNGTFHSYGFYAKNNVWYFTLDGSVIGNATLGTMSSGNNGPVAFAELANASTAKQVIGQVAFKNMQFYHNGNFTPVPYGYSYVGYGVASLTALKNPYGVEELPNRVNYFLVGSGIPLLPNSTRLWSQGYYLRFISAYYNVNTTQYPAYAPANFSVPRIVYISNDSRAAFVQWYGSGIGAYSGASNSSMVYLYSNITERAQWQPQYLFNVSSAYAAASGSGWYTPNSTVSYAISANVFYANQSSRYGFVSWSNGQRVLSSSLVLSAPLSLAARWQHQYFLNVTGAYGNVTGTGWYNASARAQLYVRTPVINLSDAHRLAFYSWSNGSTATSLLLNVTHPVRLTALFKDQYRTVFSATDAEGAPVQASLYIGNNVINGPVFLFSNVDYPVTHFSYHGYTLPLNTTINLNSSGSVSLLLPLYTLSISTTDIFGAPVNASATLQFENGTTVHTHTGPGGQILMYDIPYGSAIGNATYGGIVSAINAGYGTGVHLFFFSALDIAVFATVIIAAAVFYLLASRRLSRKREPGKQGSTQDGSR